MISKFRIPSDSNDGPTAKPDTLMLFALDGTQAFLTIFVATVEVWLSFALDNPVQYNTLSKFVALICHPALASYNPKRGHANCQVALNATTSSESV